MLVKLSLWLCRLVFFLQCATPQVLRSRARFASGSMDWMQPFCCANMFQLVSYRMPCTCSTDSFFTKHCSRHHGPVRNMLDLRRRLSFPILLRCGMMQQATAQNCFVKCVVARVRDDVEGVQLRTQPHSTMGTPHPHAVTVLRKKGVDVTSHNKRPDIVVVVVGQRGMASAQTTGADSRHAGASCRGGKVLRCRRRPRSPEVEHVKGLVAAADRHSRFLT